MYFAKKSDAQSLSILVISTILALLIGRYYHPYFIWPGGFQYGRTLCFIGIPLLLHFFYFRGSAQQLGTNRPQLDSRIKKLIIGIIVFLPLVITVIKLDSAYLSYYSHYTNSEINLSRRLLNFFLITTSTIIGWEFLLRGYFCFGLKNWMNKKLHASEVVTSALIILWIMSIEVIYHFLKPSLESWGMLLASPILTWIALKTKSFWPSLFIHLYIEGVFFFTISS